MRAPAQTPAGTAGGASVQATPVAAPTPALAPGSRAAGYMLVAELFLYPEDRDEDAIRELRAALGDSGPATGLIDAFLAAPRASDADEYLTVLELTPPCPLYLGAYLFEEPNSCRGAGVSDRNAYMLELKATYRHFGFDALQRELPDFLPLMAEFLSLTESLRARDGIGLRRRLLEQHVLPALPKMTEGLSKYESPYVDLARALEALVRDDLAGATEPAWQPAPIPGDLPVFKPDAEPLPGLGAAGRGTP